MAVLPIPVASLPVPPTAPGPYTRAAAVTPSDTVPLTTPCRAVWVGTSAPGNLAYVPALNSGASPSAAEVVLKNIPQGTLIEISAQFIMSTNTTVSDIVALW